ncbi:MAG TPA: hypothetical protein VGG37_05265 [Opitutaceae bacterium]
MAGKAGAQEAVGVRAGELDRLGNGSPLLGPQGKERVGAQQGEDGI